MRIEIGMGTISIPFTLIKFEYNGENTFLLQMILRIFYTNTYHNNFNWNIMNYGGIVEIDLLSCTNSSSYHLITYNANEAYQNSILFTRNKENQ